MTVRELYQLIGGDYDTAMAYLSSERLIARFLTKFPADPSLPRLFTAWAAQDRYGAFDAAYEAKGMCANLYLTHLKVRSTEICELLRPENEGKAKDTYIDMQVQELHRRYDAAVRHIHAWNQSS